MDYLVGRFGSSESFEKFDQVFLLLLGQRSLVVVARTKVMSTIDDIVGALAKAHQPRCQRLENFLGSLVVNFERGLLGSWILLGWHRSQSGHLSIDSFATKYQIK